MFLDVLNQTFISPHIKSQTIFLFQVLCTDPVSLHANSDQLFGYDYSTRRKGADINTQSLPLGSITYRMETAHPGLTAETQGRRQQLCVCDLTLDISRLDIAARDQCILTAQRLVSLASMEAK